MQIKNNFEIPLPPDKAWDVLMDIPRIAPCMPGAELTGQTADGGYEGKVSVKLGPVALSFNGTARFVERDDKARRTKVAASGADMKGRGGASAVVTFQLLPSGTGSRAEICTDVTLSGLVAQYGRGAGIIQGVSSQIVNQFAENLRALIGAADPQGSPEVANLRAPVEQRVKPIGGFSLLLTALWQSLKGIWSRA